MTKKINSYTLVIILVLFLSGCISHTERLVSSIEETKSNINYQIESLQPIPNIPLLSYIPTKPNPIKKYQDQTSQFVTQAHYYDWNSTMQSMICKMLKTQGIVSGGILLVDNINNQTNGFLNTNEATEKLRDLLVNNGKFKLVSTKQLFLAKQQLNLSSQDNLGSCSKAIGIARKVGAQYALYSNTTGNINSPFLQIQLMVVQTGEIIWSGKDRVTQL